MASTRREQREDARLRIMRLLVESPNLSTRQIADAVGISHGSAYYVVSALIDKGFVKIGNFTRSNRKGQYAYLLTRRGLREKAILTQSFIVRKRVEYEALRSEIEELEREVEEGKNV